MIAESRHIDTSGMAEYRCQAQASITLYDGSYRLRGASPAPVERQWAEGSRMVIIEFPSRARANEWFLAEICSGESGSIRGVRAPHVFVDGL